MAQIHGDRRAAHTERNRAGQPRMDPRIWILALGAFATGTDAQVISGILVPISQDYSVSLDAAGGIVTVYSFTYAISAPILAALTVHIRRDVAAALSMFVFAIANAACAIAPTFATLIAARIVAGIAGGLFIPSAYALAASLAPGERKGAALSSVALGITGAIVAGVPLGVLVGDRLGWHATFWLVTAMSVLAAVAIILFVPRPKTVSPSGASLTDRFAPLVDIRTLIALLPTLLALSANGGTYTYLGAILNAHGYSTEGSLLIFFFFGVGALLGSQIGGRLADRFGPTIPMICSMLVGIIDVFFYSSTLDNLYALAFATFVLGFVPWPVVLGQQKRLMSMAPKHVEVVLALNNSFVYFGVSVGAAIGGATLARGFTLDQVPFASGMLLAAALLVLVLSNFLGSDKAKVL